MLIDKISYANSLKDVNPLEKFILSAGVLVFLLMTKEKTAEDGQPEPEAEKPMEKIKKTKPEETASQALDTSALLKKKEKRNHSV